MNNETITTLISILVVVASIAQIVILVIQNKQARLQLISDYRTRWSIYYKNWGQIIFIGRDPGEYYQVTDEKTLKKLKIMTEQSNLYNPTIWARDSVRIVCSLLSEVSLRIIQGQLYVSEVYPIFGTELLRHSNPIRKILDTDNYFSFIQDDKHMSIRGEVQDWLIYHDGIRRRCLILLDLLWAEAVRMEDLPPSDTRSAADAKEKTGKLNRNRVFKETYRLGGLTGLMRGLKLSYFLRHAEYQSILNRIGINRGELKKLETDWTRRLLKNNNLHDNNLD